MAAVYLEILLEGEGIDNRGSKLVYFNMGASSNKLVLNFTFLSLRKSQKNTH